MDYFKILFCVCSHLCKNRKASMSLNIPLDFDQRLWVWERTLASWIWKTSPTVVSAEEAHVTSPLYHLLFVSTPFLSSTLLTESLQGFWMLEVHVFCLPHVSAWSLHSIVFCSVYLLQVQLVLLVIFIRHTHCVSWGTCTKFLGTEFSRFLFHVTTLSKKPLMSLCGCGSFPRLYKHSPHKRFEDMFIAVNAQSD